MITDRRKRGYTFVIVAVITMFLWGCRSSPVSPSTVDTMTVRYGIPSQAHVTLRVINSYNTRVATLVDTTENQGTYSVSWSTAAYPAGIYFYTLIAAPVGGGTTLNFTKKFIIE